MPSAITYNIWLVYLTIRKYHITDKIIPMIKYHLLTDFIDGKKIYVGKTKLTTYFRILVIKERVNYIFGL